MLHFYRLMIVLSAACVLCFLHAGTKPEAIARSLRLPHVTGKISTHGFPGLPPRHYQKGNTSTYSASDQLQRRVAVEMLPKFRPENHEMVPKLKHAFQEAVMLAAATHSNGATCDAAWNKYFRPEGADFVRAMFGVIAGAFENNLPLGSRLFSSRVTIWAGDYPSYDICATGGEHEQGYAVNELKDVESQVKHADIAICPPVWDLPHLSEIDVDDLGGKDSPAMTPLAGAILHELMHVVAFSSVIPGSEQLLAFGDSAEPNAVADYLPAEGDHSYPPDGYGFAFCNGLRRFKGPLHSRSNADSYVSYALSRWWSEQAGEEFGPPDLLA